MSVRFLIIVDGVVENIVVAETKECLVDLPGAVLQTAELADVCLGWKLRDGRFVDPYVDADLGARP